MTPILLLEAQDVVLKTDFCRPLFIEATGSTCDAEGYPKNHAKWAPVSLVIPHYFQGMKVESLHEEGYKYEFVRGSIPDTNKLDMRLYPIKAPTQKRRANA